MRTIDPHVPARSGRTDGLAWNLFLPRSGEPRAGVVTLHGAGSRKERHHDFARAACTFGFAALALDARGHGESDAPMDARVLDDVATAADQLRIEIGDLPLALRGSSMGGFMALGGAAKARADAVLVICPAPGELLERGVRSGRFEFAADADALSPVLTSTDLTIAAAALTVPVMILHARGDESVPVESSRAIAAGAGDNVTLVEIPGGDHQSIQHDAELQGVSLRFLQKALKI